jgi:hypothetical protein
MKNFGHSGDDFLSELVKTCSNYTSS